MLRPLIHQLPILAVLMLLAFVVACEEEEEPDPCEQYCAAASDCSHASHQMFSMSECTRECHENLERAGSVYCDDRFVEYLFCRTDLYCADWGDYGQYCAAEIDWLDTCVGGNS